MGYSGVMSLQEALVSLIHNLHLKCKDRASDWPSVERHFHLILNSRQIYIWKGRWPASMTS